MSNTKQDLIRKVIKNLSADLEVLKKAALETHKNSTSEQSKQEGKYDTRGLEASYLAEAQAGKVIQLEENISKLKQIPTEDFNDDQPIALGAMTIVSTDQDDLPYFMLPAGGGMNLFYQGLDFVVITPESPIGTELLGKKLGAKVTIPNTANAYISDLW